MVRSAIRQIGSIVATAVVLLGVLPLVGASPAQAAGATTNFSCGSLYSLQGAGTNPGARTVWSVDPNTGAATTAATFTGVTGTLNALGITEGGSAAYGVSSNGTARTIYRLDTATGRTTSVAGVADTPITHGAVNPRNGFYYYGGFVGTTLKIYGFDPNTGQSLGLVAQGTMPTDGGNGDWAFDQQGRLYVVGGANGANSMFVVNEEIPTSGPTVPITGSRITSISTPGQALNGIAFASDGYLYLASGTTLYRVNPSTGAVIDSRPLSQSGSVDFGSCASPNTISVQKNFPQGRVNPTDQATLTISGGGINSGNSATTAGTDSGLQSDPAEIAGPVFGLAGTTYTVSESGAGTTESSPTAAGYERSWVCVNQNNGQTLASGVGTTGQFTMPNGGAAGVAALCTFTDVAKVARVDLDKTAGPINDVNGSGPSAGDTIDYSFKVTNTGTVPLQTTQVTDPKVGPVSCPAGELAVGASKTCTATYRLTQADVDAGTVSNTARATGTATNLPNATDDDSVNTPVPVRRAISLEKQAGPINDVDRNGQDAGDTIDYRFTVTNTGNVTLNPVTVQDPKVGPVTCVATSLAPGATTTCTAAPYALSQADVDAGRVENTATATGRAPDGSNATSSSSTTTPITGVPAIALSKVVDRVSDVNGNGLTDAGDTIAYKFLVTNTGNVTLNPVSVQDSKVGPVTCPQPILAAGASTTCTAAPYALSQADVDAGKVDNTATATGRSPSGQSVTADDTETTAVRPGASVALAKTVAEVSDVNGNGMTDAGDTVGYRFTVTNTGNVTLNPISVQDSKVGPVTCPVTALAPGDSTDCTAAAHVLTQSDVDSGRVDNTATATGQPPSGSPVTASDTAEASVPAAPGISMEKNARGIDDADGNGPDAGDTVQYAFTVTNTGNVTLNSIAINDAEAAPVRCAETSLAPGAATQCTGSHALTQADVDAGQVDNTATVSGQPPAGSPVTSTDGAETPIPASAQLALDKVSDGVADANHDTRSDAGDTIGYHFVVTNTGNVTLDRIAVNDPRVGAVNCPAGPLAPGSSTTCTANPYLVNQSDVDVGRVDNTATATGTPPGGTPVQSTDTTTTPVDGQGGLALVKNSGEVQDANSDGVSDPGDTITYTFSVTNQGTVTLDPVTVTDTKVGPVTCPDGPLAPGDTVDCTAPAYTLTQADIDAGRVDNSATASGQPPSGDPVTAQDNVVTLITRLPAISLDKTAGPINDVDGNGPNAGDTIDYTFQVANTGNVTLTLVGVLDTKTPVSCPKNVLAPHESTTCTSTYTISQVDVDAGKVDNEADATGKPPSGDPVIATDTTSTPITGAPAIALQKSAGGLVDVDGNGPDVGDTIDYTFQVTNRGAVTLDQIAVTDPKVGAVSCPTGPLAPGQSVTCTAKPYVLNQSDVDAGRVDNTATVTGTPPGGNPVTANGGTSTPIEAGPAIQLDKRAGDVIDLDGNGPDAGDTIDYSFLVTNGGNATLNEVALADAKVPASCPKTSLAPGESMTCSARYVLSQADVDARQVDNTAAVIGRPPSGNPVTSSDSTKTPVRPRPVPNAPSPAPEHPGSDLATTGLNVVLPLTGGVVALAVGTVLVMALRSRKSR